MSAKLLGIIMLTASLVPFGGSAHRKTERGNSQYLDGLYEEALRSYTEAQVDAPEAPQLYYDIGNVLYRQGDYDGAAEAFERSLLSAPQEMLPMAAYNLGNARYRLQEFKEAADAYQRSLKEDPGDVDAKRNLELALRALQQQQQQQQQQDQQNDGGEEQNQQQQQGESEQQEGQEQQQPPGDREQQRNPGEQEPPPDRMTEQQAARLLDNLSEQERESLRQYALERVRTGSRDREKDW
jgi:Ca-activated chloride channel family protein